MLSFGILCSKDVARSSLCWGKVTDCSDRRPCVRKARIECGRDSGNGGRDGEATMSGKNNNIRIIEIHEMRIMG